jgi:hypothetical protein
MTGASEGWLMPSRLNVPQMCGLTLKVGLGLITADAVDVPSCYASIHVTSVNIPQISVAVLELVTLETESH